MTTTCTCQAYGASKPCGEPTDGSEFCHPCWQTKCLDNNAPHTRVGSNKLIANREMVDVKDVEYVASEVVSLGQRMWAVGRRAGSHDQVFAFYSSGVQATQIANFLNDQRKFEVQR